MMERCSSTIRQSHRIPRASRKGAKTSTRSFSHERNVFPPRPVRQVVTRPPATTLETVATKPVCAACEPLLQASFHAHQSAILKVVMLKDENGVQEFATSSMDKTMKFWKVEENDLGGTVISLQTVEEGPVFSMAVDTYTLDRPRSIFCGTSNKDVVVWQAPSPKIVPREQVSIGGHSGWVRDLAIEDRWLFSCGCNQLLQWDLAWPVPKKSGVIELFTGDIQCIVTSPGQVHVACSNGSLRSWGLATNGELVHSREVLDAHSGRILALAHHQGVLYTAGVDGAIKAWDAHSYQLLHVIDGAHDGQKINCAAVSATGVLYTGGHDNCIRAWRLPSLTPCAEPIHQHEEGVRALAVSHSHLVSADSAGKISLWETALPHPCKV